MDFKPIKQQYERSTLMKRFLTLAFVAAIGLAVAGTASAEVITSGGVAAYPAGASANGIANSRHNLGAFGEHVTAQNLDLNTGGVATGTSEICVFCHTPHHANKTDFGAPLWNRGIDSTTFIAYGTTVGGTVATASDVVGSSSLACLSCHDGTTSFDNLVNAPGKGGGVGNGNGGGAVDGQGAVQGWQPFAEKAANVGAGRLGIGANDQGALTNDLSNDHPMSITYNGGTVASLRLTSTVISDLGGDGIGTGLNEGIGYLLQPEKIGNAEYTANLAQNRWAVSGFISDTATIADLLRGGKVECASCHDPHFNNKSWDEVDITYSAAGFETAAGQEADSNGMFLRRVGGNTGSGVCRTCHNK